MKSNPIFKSALLLIVFLIIYSFGDNSNSGVDINSIDKSINPNNDFYTYANGNWLKSNPVPASENRWASSNIVSERNYTLVSEILKNSLNDKDAPIGSPNQKIRDFYKVLIDSVKRESDGYKPLSEEFEKIKSIKSKNDLITEIAHLHLIGINTVFSFNVEQDLKQNDRYISSFGQCLLSLPDKDYYTKEDESSKKIRDEYRSHISKMFTLYGEKKEQANLLAIQVLDFETNLAKSSMNRLERRDIEKLYNKKNYNEFKSNYSSLDWNLYLSVFGIDKVKEVIVSQPVFFENLNSIFSNISLDKWKLYLRWSLIDQTSQFLNSALEKQDFAFFQKILRGTKAQKPIWKRSVDFSNNYIGELVAQAYVKVAFSPDLKQRINIMVDNLFEAYKARIEKLTWMSEETKIKALKKLSTFVRKLGYPDKWKDYSSLEIKNDFFVKNVFRSNEFNFKDQISKLNKPVDKTEWDILPQTVNAYYNPLQNEIVFPASIMQPPFFNPEADDAVNYGSIGAVIGHEISHGFDDSGSKFDADGNMMNWWNSEDKRKFDEKTEILVKQYSSYVVLDTLKINGKLTLGENIADLGGLCAAYDAYQLSLREKKPEVINGYTADQRFFLGFAQVWKTNIRPEMAKQLLMIDVHSPAKYRVIGTLSNMPIFYKAFGLKKSDKMYIDENEQAHIW